jgi:hypothetical protein
MRSSPLYYNGPSLLRATVRFISLATLSVMVIGWLTQRHILPMQTDLALSAHPLLRLWIAAGGLVLGTLLPLGGLVRWWRVREVRQVVGVYLLALLMQVLTEGVLGVIFFPSIVVLIGTLYTAFRVWYLWHAQRILATVPHLDPRTRARTRGGVLVLLLVWLINLTIVLLGISWPHIL